MIVSIISFIYEIQSKITDPHQAVGFPKNQQFIGGYSPGYWQKAS